MWSMLYLFKIQLYKYYYTNVNLLLYDFSKILELRKNNKIRQFFKTFYTQNNEKTFFT